MKKDSYFPDEFIGFFKIKVSGPVSEISGQNRNCQFSFYLINAVLINEYHLT